MKKHVLGWLFFASSFSLFGQETAVGVVDSIVYKEYELAPIFMGCGQIERNAHERLVCASELLHNFIYDNLQYPAAAKQSKTQGIVVVNFVVETDGSTTGWKAMNFISKDCNEEALRIAKSMPAWLPAERNGVKVRSEGSIAVRFKLLQDGSVYRPIFVAPKPFVPSIAIAEKPKIQTIPDEDGQKEKPLAPFVIYSEQRDMPLAPDMPFDEEVFKVVEDKPHFPGCEDVEDPIQKQKCAEPKMLGFLYGNLKYPPEAKERKIEGTLYIKFIVGKDGTIYSPEIVRGLGWGCDEEALRVVSMMPKWEPGKQRGRPVNVQFNLPVKFRL